MSDDPTDPTLELTQRELRSARDGDRDALESLFARYLPRVRGMVAARMGRSLRQFVEVEDIVQETLRDAVLGIDRIDQGSEGLFVHWLARCVENNVRDVLRRGLAAKRGGGRELPLGSLDQSLSESVFAGRDFTASQIVRGQELEERVEAGLLLLGERYREVISLRLRGGLSFREIAEVMELPSENTANVLFLRARSRLRELVEPA